MTFNSNARINPKRVQRRGAGRRSGARGTGTGMAVGGGGIGGLLLLILGAIFGVNLLGGDYDAGGSPVVAPDPTVQAEFEERCVDGAAANMYDDCRVLFTIGSLDDYWETAAPAIGINFQYPGVVVFDDVTSSPCGTASAQTGPFYCPADRTMYIDTAFFELLSRTFGAGDAPLAQMYVVAHEYAHHIQVGMGVFEVADRRQSGPNSDAVKVELMADCLAGVWLHHATNTKDEFGNTILEPITRTQLEDAIAAAEAVGDDTIQETLQGNVEPHNYTHGTADQRSSALIAGVEHGSPAACDLFGLADGSGTF